MYSSLRTTAAAVLAMAAGSANAQAGPNTISQYNPNYMTMSPNLTYNVLPINSSIVESIVAPKKLVPMSMNTALYPNGWPAGTHPVMVSGGYDGSIKQLGLNIPPYLMSARIEIPCVDQLNDGKTCFRHGVVNYVGGVTGQQFDAGLVPSLVGSAEGTTVLPGYFTPDGEALQNLGNGQYSFEVDALLLPNPVSGPALGPEAFQFILSKTSSSPLLTAKGFHNFINQPIILSNGQQCVDSYTFFNESFAQPFFCQSEVTIYNYVLQANGVPTDLAGTYNGTCYSANGESVQYSPESCQQAEADLNPAAFQRL